MARLRRISSITYDEELGGKLRQLVNELKEWADRARKKKLRTQDIEQMENQSKSLSLLISNREL